MRARGRRSSERKATTALLPYALWRGRGGDGGVLDNLLRALGYHMWEAIAPLIPALLNKASSQTILHISLYVPWNTEPHNQDAVIKWATAVSVFQYTGEASPYVVRTLLWIASVDSLRPHIPVNVWSWLNERPSFSSESAALLEGTKRAVVCQVRALGDIEILKSYFFVVWSESNYLDVSGHIEMQASLRGDFSGIEKGHHREDLITRLDQVLEQLDRRRVRFTPPFDDPWTIQLAKGRYRRLRQVLLEVGREGM